MEELWGGGGWIRRIVLLAVVLVNCKCGAFKAGWKFVQSDKSHVDLNSTQPELCVSVIPNEHVLAMRLMLFWLLLIRC